MRRSIRVRGRVQGVGFRPAVWHLARRHNLCGSVCNDGNGVLIDVLGALQDLEEFTTGLGRDAPPLADITAITWEELAPQYPLPEAFTIAPNQAGKICTGIIPDAATCPACCKEIFSPEARRYQYPFTNCTHCGPRLSIIHAIPYERNATTMADFPLCTDCHREYNDPGDRRFHAQPIACPACGPRLWLEDWRGSNPVMVDGGDPLDETAAGIRAGKILAIKGIGGFHLACDAGNHTAVSELRRRKQRYGKPFALMARDTGMIRRYAIVHPEDEALLASPQAPIVILACATQRLPAQITPDEQTLGFMLPYSPLHHLLLALLDRPIVLTSGNRSHAPQCIGNEEAQKRLHGIADMGLMHDREIAQRLDDSVVRRVAGAPRFLRRARGYAPDTFKLPPGFSTTAPTVLAMGGELKNTFCLVHNGQAVLSQYHGDLEDASVLREFYRNLDLYQRLYDFRPDCIAVDRHPAYLSTQAGTALAADKTIDCRWIQHHHAHIAAVMGEHGVPIDGEPVLGIALDGLGYGDPDGLWGGEFLRCDYHRFQRLAAFDAVALPGGHQAVHEPWRNTYAHLAHSLGWTRVLEEFGNIGCIAALQDKPLPIIADLIAKGLNSPRASSCGRLFDAVAGALGLSPERVMFEGQAAVRLEVAAQECFSEVEAGYRASVVSCENPIQLKWAALWHALLRDLQQGVAVNLIAARFHRGLIDSITALAIDIANTEGLETVCLGGGSFQNTLLLTGISETLTAAGLKVLAPGKIPANDSALSFGQGLVTTAQLITESQQP